MRRALCTAAVVAGLVLIAGCGGGHAVHRGLFAPTSVWNARLADDQPLDSHSDVLVKEMRRIIDKVSAAHDGPWIASRLYSTPVYIVPGDQPRVRVKLDVQEASNMQGAFSSVPVPPNARPADGLDEHMTIWQPATDTLWEFWKFQRHSDGWHARWGGGMHNVSSSPGYFDSSSWPGAKPWWGATGSSLPLLGGLITLNQLRARKIDHALAFSLPAIRKGFYSVPAQRTDGRDPRPEAIPMGARFRLDPKLDLTKLGLSPLALMVGQAIQHYGMVLRDTSTTFQFYAEDFTPSGNNPFPALVGPDYPSNYWRQLLRIPWDRLQALPLDLHPQR